jgi:hypothetical protein
LAAPGSFPPTRLDFERFFAFKQLNLKMSVGQKKMRASAGVNWHLGWSSRNAETVKNAKSALEAYFLLDFSPPASLGPCIGGQVCFVSFHLGKEMKNVGIIINYIPFVGRVSSQFWKEKY